MYELLFRSRWFALAWVVLMTISALMFTTTGPGAVITGTAPKSRASDEASASQIRFKAWAEDEETDVLDGDAVVADQARDTVSRDEISPASAYNAAPYANADSANSEIGNGQ